MEVYERDNHTVWAWKHCVVRVTKYRYAVLGGGVASSPPHGRTNPALSRNPKPPPLGGGAFTRSASSAMAGGVRGSTRVVLAGTIGSILAFCARRHIAP